MSGRIAKKIKRGVLKYGMKYKGGIILSMPPKQQKEGWEYRDRLMRRSGRNE